MIVDENKDGTFTFYRGCVHHFTVDLAELVEIRAACDRALMDCLARNISRCRCGAFHVGGSACEAQT